MVKKSQSKFPEILRALLEEKNISMREAARITGVPASTLASWIRGSHRASDYDALVKLAHHLGVGLSFLLTGTHESPTHARPKLTEIFESNGIVFDGYLKIRIEHMVPRGPFPEGKQSGEDSDC